MLAKLIDLPCGSEFEWGGETYVKVPLLNGYNFLGKCSGCEPHSAIQQKDTKEIRLMVNKKIIVSIPDEIELCDAKPGMKIKVSTHNGILIVSSRKTPEWQWCWNTSNNKMISIYIPSGSRKVKVIE